MIGGRRIAVVIPAYNERDLLPVTLASLPDYVDEVVLVDDASVDDTVEVARGVERVKSRLHVCQHHHNAGVGAAIVTGYRWCLEREVDVAVVVGADNQMHPDDMAGLILPVLRDEADYVTGDRLAWPGGWRHFPPVRLAGVVALASMTRWATGLRQLRDAQCGYTAIGRRGLERLELRALYPRYGFPNDLLAKAVIKGLRVTTRPVRPVYGEERSAMSIPRVVAPLLRLTWRNRRAVRDARRSGAGAGASSYASNVSEVSRSTPSGRRRS